MKSMLCTYVIFCLALVNGLYGRKPSVAPIKPLHVSHNVSPEAKTTTATTTEKIITTTVPARACSDGQSSFAKWDLNNIIDFFAKQINLIDKINGSYYDLAVNTRDKHLKSIEDFKLKFEKRPSHVDHILEDLAKIRVKTFEPLVKKIDSKKPEITTLANVHEQNVVNSNVNFEKFTISKKICELNCDTEPNIRYKRSINKRKTTSGVYYCATIKDIRDKISSFLTQFQDDYVDKLQNFVITTDDDLSSKIDELKLKLRETAVKEFGSTMYDVLSLEDEYDHFLNLLNDSDNIESKLSDIKKNNSIIGYKIDELKINVEKYRKYCLGCNQLSRQRREVLQNSPTSQTITDDVLDGLLAEYVNEIQSLFDANKVTLLEELDKIFSDQDAYIEDALSKLQPLKEDIKKNLEKEEGELNKLKDSDPENFVKNVKKLEEDTRNLINQIEETLKFIHGVIG